MSLTLRPMTEVDAAAIMGWQYEPPYDLYAVDPPPDGIDEVIQFFTHPRNAYYSLITPSGDLEAFCCFGHDAQVPGGDYSADALDIGLQLRPDLIQAGGGERDVKDALDFGSGRFAPTQFRTTVAQFSAPEQRLWEGAGFRPVQTFASKDDGTPFVLLVADGLTL